MASLAASKAEQRRVVRPSLVPAELDAIAVRKDDNATGTTGRAKFAGRPLGSGGRPSGEMDGGGPERGTEPGL